jgi:hypothetical protein
LWLKNLWAAGDDGYDEYTVLFGPYDDDPYDGGPLMVVFQLSSCQLNFEDICFPVEGER